jgi:hypothetical protein
MIPATVTSCPPAPSPRPELAIRWAIGDVSARGFTALGLSIWGAWRLFGPDARYVVCANTLPIAAVRARVGPVPAAVDWVDATALLPRWLRGHVDAGLAGGVLWKLAPPRVHPDRKELALDNDCILWDIPAALQAWLDDGAEDSVLVAEDVRAGYGQFSSLCGPEPRNLGVRGLPAGLDLDEALRTVLRERPVQIARELDEQGLQMAALTRGRRVRVVSLDDVSVCSPFPPHLPHLGRAGAHFCGVNVKQVGWSLDGRPAEWHLAAFWDRHLDEVRARVGRAAPIGTTAEG